MKSTKTEQDYEKIFEAWADFGDEECPEEVSRVIENHSLGSFDSISFMAYCAGFQKAESLFKEE